jgi:small Trp-rich protein
MWLVMIGALLLALKLAEIGPVANWDWWWVLLPFGAAVAWWAFADSTGLTQKRAIQRMEDRKRQRRERDMVALGLDVKRDRSVQAMRDRAARRGQADGDSRPSASPDMHETRRDERG